MISMSTQTKRQYLVPFDLDSNDDDLELKNWCRNHWDELIGKAVKYKNAPIYHECCLTFSKKGCVKRHSHPSLQSASVLKIPSIMSTTSPEAFHLWIRQRLKLRHRMDKPVYFPSINSAHFDEDTKEESDDMEDKVEMLGKRLEMMNDLQEKTNEEMRQLKEDNKRLLASSKNWHSKYLDLQFKWQDETASYADTTPCKKLKISSNFENLLSL